MVADVRSEQQARRRARVVDAAMALAADGGYDAVQMRAVSQRADVALGTIYRYFSSKDQLLLAALDQLAQGMQDEVQRRPPRGETVAARVADVLRRCCALLEEKPQLTHAVVTALSSTETSIDGTTGQVQERLASIILAALDGHPVDDIDGVVYVLGMVWFAAMLRWVGGRSKDGTMFDDLELASRLMLRRH